MLALAASASATNSYDFGSLALAPSYDYANNSVAVGSFTDQISFTFPAGAGGLGGAAHGLKVDVPWGALLDISGLGLRLLNASFTEIAVGTATSQGLQLAVGALTPGGTYYFEVTGTGTGISGGLYSLTAAAAPVPEPTAAAMLLAGFAVMGFIAMRRRRQD